MANTFPHARPHPPALEELSLPATLRHRQLDRARLRPRATRGDRDYRPEASQTQSLSSDSGSFAEESSFSRSSYDPLENIEEYLRMRDQL